MLSLEIGMIICIAILLLKLLIDSPLSEGLTALLVLLLLIAVVPLILLALNNICKNAGMTIEQAISLFFNYLNHHKPCKITFIIFSSAIILTFPIGIIYKIVEYQRLKP